VRLNARIAFSLAIALLAAWALVESQGWALRTALYPRVTAVPLLVLAVVESVLSLRGKDEEGDEAEPMDFAATASVPPDVATRRTIVTTGWVAGFFASVVLFGFPIAIPLFVFAYVKGQGKEGWLPSLLLSALALLGFHVLFVRLLHVPLPVGLLWQVFTR